MRHYALSEHPVTPSELAPVVAAYREIRSRRQTLPANPGVAAVEVVKSGAAS
ncbi:hypothetical protein [Nocardia abscessus]|uniref:hypothetical protein n=1 Tax=Nocardia abscessus TaxID=120957 RepID=UPI002458D30F|nr:hypothetical protein [Nocardia abscessus]